MAGDKEPDPLDELGWSEARKVLWAKINVEDTPESFYWFYRTIIQCKQKCSYSRNHQYNNYDLNETIKDTIFSNC